MKKAPITLTTLCALTVTTVALAQEPGGPTPTPPEAPGPAAAPIPPSAAIAPPELPSQGHPQAQAEPCPTATTTITAADMTEAPPPSPPPPRETITVRQAYRPNRPLLYTGGSMLISSYAATAAFTFTQGVRDGNGDQPLYIPVAGPWLHLANTQMGMLDKVLVAGSGVAQGAGVAIGILSFLVPEHVPAATIQAGDVKVNFTATSYGRGSAGIGAVGQF
jgi:hypothetical protein